jgi:hypothetical protein
MAYGPSADRVAPELLAEFRGHQRFSPRVQALQLKSYISSARRRVVSSFQTPIISAARRLDGPRRAGVINKINALHFGLSRALHILYSCSALLGFDRYALKCSQRLPGQNSRVSEVKDAQYDRSECYPRFGKCQHCSKPPGSFESTQSEVSRRLAPLHHGPAERGDSGQDGSPPPAPNHQSNLKLLLNGSARTQSRLRIV